MAEGKQSDSERKRDVERKSRQGPEDRHRNQPRTLADQARERLDAGEAAKPGGDEPEEPRTAGVQGKDPRGKTHHD